MTSIAIVLMKLSNTSNRQTGCETGRYGRNCNNTCDQCKNRDTCDIDSGKCDDWGCARKRFSPPFCTCKF